MKWYRKQVVIALDQLLNTILGGWADEMLSARCWRRKWLLRYALDYVVFLWQKDEAGRRHCEQCYWHELERKDMPEEYRIKYSTKRRRTK